MCLDSVWTQSTKHSYMYLRVLLWMTRRDRTGISSWEASKVAAHSFLDLQSKAEALTVNRKETIVWKNYWKKVSITFGWILNNFESFKYRRDKCIHLKYIIPKLCLYLFFARGNVLQLLLYLHWIDFVFHFFTVWLWTNYF